jgi:hypothetical protein
MGVREKLNQHRRLSLIGAALVVALAGGLLYMQLADGSTSNGVPKKQYMTTDDGKTFFLADAELLPPCQINGKTAYLAYVFTNDGGKTKWVGFIERYSDAAKKKLAEMRKKRMEQKLSGPPSVVPELLNGSEVKKPGDANWVKRSDLAHINAILDVRCPNDPDRAADIVIP